MNDQDRVERIFRDVLESEDVRLEPSAVISDLPGWDSLAQVSLFVALEEHFTIRFSSREMSVVETVGDLLALLKEHGISVGL